MIANKVNTNRVNINKANNGENHNYIIKTLNNMEVNWWVNLVIEKVKV